METRVGQTFVLSFGSPANPPLVLLHGSAANSSTWGGEASLYASRFRVHAVDLPGETGKSTGNRPPYEGSCYADWLTDVFDNLGLASAPIVGLSLGGWAALKFAAASPGRVVCLALLAPGGVAPARPEFNALADAALREGEPGIRHMTAALFSPETPPPGLIDAFVFMHSVYIARRDDLPVLSDEELRQVTCPALLLGGARDAVLDMPATAARLETLLPRVHVELEPDGGHVVVNRGRRICEFLGAP